MITVNVEKSNKCNGNYSAYLSFPYDEEIIGAVKSMSDRAWDNTNKVWEIPYGSLLDFLVQFSNHEIQLQGSIYEAEHDLLDDLQVTYDYDFKTIPYSYQVDGFNYGMNHNNWLLADEQGCVSGDSFVKIKEQGKPATRNIKIKYLKDVFDNDNTVKIKSLVNGRFAYMPIKAVVDKGIQKTIELTLEDTSIQCTPDHLIYTENGWVEADKLNVGDKVFTNGIQTCPMCGTTENLVTYKYSKFLGYCKSCMYAHRNGTKYNEITKKLDKSGYVRLFGKATRTMPNYDKTHGFGIYEHHQVWYENTGHIVDTATEVVHHKNGIKTDNRFENLQLMAIDEHAKLHSDTKTNHLYQFNENIEFIERNGTKIYLKPRLQEVKAKTSLGSQQVWDIAIDDNDIHNFICNNIVVHNCGKTKQIIDIACAKKQYMGYQHCLIICGVNGLKWNWANEVKKHSNEDVYILGQKTRKNGRLYIGSSEDKLTCLDNIDELPYFLITNVETLRYGVKTGNKVKKMGKFVDEVIYPITDRITTLCNEGKINMVAIDEIHRCKNSKSQQGEQMLRVVAETNVAMTGTPLMNKPFDIYTIMKWLGYEKHSLYQFSQHYCVYGGWGGHEVVGYKNLEELNGHLNTVMLRRLKSDVFDLPEKVYIDEYVEMGSAQTRVYNQALNGLLNDMESVYTAVNPLSTLIRLRQATGYTGIVSEVKESAKLDRLEELAEEIVENGEKFVVFSNWTAMTDVIEERLAKYNPVVVTGETKDEDRMVLQSMFQENPECKCIIGTIGALGTGFTLTAGNNVIFVDHPWNRALYDQAVDRCHRIGTTKTVTVYNLLTKETIDERVWEIMNAKGELSDAIVDGKLVKNKKALVDYLLS